MTPLPEERRAAHAGPGASRRSGGRSRRTGTTRRRRRCRRRGAEIERRSLKLGKSRDDKRRHFVRDEVLACKALTDIDVFLTHEAPRPFYPWGAASILRLVVPDAGAYLRAYGQSWKKFAAMRPLERTENGWKDHWSSNVYSTQMEFINFVFRQNYEHKYAYDEETMIRILRQAGFSKAVREATALRSIPR